MMRQHVTSTEQRRWVNEPSEDYKENHALICYSCHFVIFGQRCLWHHCKKCVQLTRVSSPHSLYGQTLLQARCLGQHNHVYGRLSWIDCNVCELQWPGRCTPCFETPWQRCNHFLPVRRARTSWTRFTYRMMCLAIVRSKLKMICKAELLIADFHILVANFM